MGMGNFQWGPRCLIRYLLSTVCTKGFRIYFKCHLMDPNGLCTLKAKGINFQLVVNHLHGFTQSNQPNRFGLHFHTTVENNCSQIQRDFCN